MSDYAKLNTMTVVELACKIDEAERKIATVLKELCQELGMAFEVEVAKNEFQIVNGIEINKVRVYAMVR